MTKAEKTLKSLSTPAAAARQRTFFKTGPGQYSAHDRFMGVTVPVIRKVAKEFHGLELRELEKLLQSSYNETRLLALLILGEQYKHGGEKARAAIYRLYLKNARQVNNWNLVDASAHYIVGAHLLSSPSPVLTGEGRGEGKSRSNVIVSNTLSLTLSRKNGKGNSRDILYKLAKSKTMWDRRIAVVSTYAFIRAGDFGDILTLSAALLNDGEDLMHKACGWMLREVGKKDVGVLEGFLKKHHADMPRTMLRYAIERFPEDKRKKYLLKQ